MSFRDSLSSVERTRARLALIERLGEELGIDGVDVIPLDRAPDALLAEILRDGILVHGSESELESYRSQAQSDEGKPEEFDDVLEDIETLV